MAGAANDPGALADQTWYHAWADQIPKHGTPKVFTEESIEAFSKRETIPRDVESLWRRLAKGAVLFDEVGQGAYCHTFLANVYVSSCYSCNELTIWRHDTVLYPPDRHEVEPNPDMDAEIRDDFNEARAVLDASPRSAAALLRLCIQKLCKQIGKTGVDLNNDIASLVKDGLNPKVQRALDTVRVIGNEAVHPGTMGLRDDRDTAAKLFELVNYIANDRISHPAQVNALYASLPPTKITAIENRDGSTGESQPKREEGE